MQQFATVIEAFEFESSGSAVTHTFFNGKPFRCFGVITYSEGNNLAITMKDVDGNNLFAFTGTQTNVMDITFIADNGLAVSIAAPGTPGVVTVLAAQVGS